MRASLLQITHHHTTTMARYFASSSALAVIVIQPRNFHRQLVGDYVQRGRKKRDIIPACANKCFTFTRTLSRIKEALISSLREVLFSSFCVFSEMNIWKAAKRAASLQQLQQQANSSIVVTAPETFQKSYAIPYENIPGPKPLPFLGNSWRFLPYIGEPFIHLLGWRRQIISIRIYGLRYVKIQVKVFNTPKECKAETYTNQRSPFISLKYVFHNLLKTNCK